MVTFGMGHFYASLGIAIAVIMTGIGSSLGVGRGGIKAGALLAKDPRKFMDLLIIQLLPSTQSIYGFVVAFMGLNKFGMLGGTLAAMTPTDGIVALMLCMPVAVVGLISAIYQGKVAMSCMEMLVRNDKQLVKGLIMCALVEIFAILAFLISLLSINGMAIQ